MRRFAFTASVVLVALALIVIYISRMHDWKAVGSPAGVFKAIHYNASNKTWKVYGNNKIWDPAKDLIREYPYESVLSQPFGYSEATGIACVWFVSNEILIFSEASDPVKYKINDITITWAQVISKEFICVTDKIINYLLLS